MPDECLKLIKELLNNAKNARKTEGKRQDTLEIRQKLPIDVYLRRIDKLLSCIGEVQKSRGKEKPSQKHNTSAGKSDESDASKAFESAVTETALASEEKTKTEDTASRAEHQTGDAGTSTVESHKTGQGEGGREPTEGMSEKPESETKGPVFEEPSRMTASAEYKENPEWSHPSPKTFKFNRETGEIMESGHGRNGQLSRPAYPQTLGDLLRELPKELERPSQDLLDRIEEETRKASKWEVFAELAKHTDDKRAVKVLLDAFSNQMGEENAPRILCQLTGQFSQSTQDKRILSALMNYIEERALGGDDEFLKAYFIRLLEKYGVEEAVSKSLVHQFNVLIEIAKQDRRDKERKTNDSVQETVCKDFCNDLKEPLAELEEHMARTLRKPGYSEEQKTDLRHIMEQMKALYKALKKYGIEPVENLENWIEQKPIPYDREKHTKPKEQDSVHGDVRLNSVGLQYRKKAQKMPAKVEIYGKQKNTDGNREGR